MSTAVGIDLGTTNSCLAYVESDGRCQVCLNPDGNATTPSAVAVDAQGKVLVGAEAIEKGMLDSVECATQFKRQMGNDAYLWCSGNLTFTPEELSAKVLHYLIDAAEAELGHRPESAVVTVPAYFKNPERQATRRAIELAGLQELQIVNEPTAAAIAYDSKRKPGVQNLLVYDLGGGTFDVTVLQTAEDGAKGKTSVLASIGDKKLGGIDWDNRLSMLLAERFQNEHGKDMFDDPAAYDYLTRQTMLAKHALSTLQSHRVNVSINNFQGSVEVSNAEFSQACSDLIDRTLDLVTDAVQMSGVEKTDIGEVVLVGGSTRMPMIHSALKQYFGFDPSKSINPDEAVAIGAARLADTLQKQDAPLPCFSRPGSADGLTFRPVRDVTNHSLGMIAVNDSGDVYTNAIILSRFQPIPCEDYRPFRYRFSNHDDAIKVFLTQGETDDPQKATYLGCYTLRTTQLSGIQLNTASIIDFCYRYDASGLVSVYARQQGHSDWQQLDEEMLPDDVPDRFLEPPAQQSVAHIALMICIDVSGSMSGKPLDAAKKAARELVAGLDLATSSVGIGVVSDRSRVLLEPSQNINHINRSIDSITCGSEGIGNSADPFDDVYTTLSNQGDLRAGVVLADGVWAYQDKAIERARRCHVADIDIVGIGFGRADKQFINKISSQRDLSFFTTESGLSGVFSDVAQVLNARAGIGS